MRISNLPLRRRNIPMRENMKKKSWEMLCSFFPNCLNCSMRFFLVFWFVVVFVFRSLHFVFSHVFHSMFICIIFLMPNQWNGNRFFHLFHIGESAHEFFAMKFCSNCIKSSESSMSSTTINPMSEHIANRIANSLHVILIFISFYWMQNEHPQQRTRANTIANGFSLWNGFKSKHTYRSFVIFRRQQLNVEFNIHIHSRLFGEHFFYCT